MKRVNGRIRTRKIRKGRTCLFPQSPHARTVPDNKRDIVGRTDVNPDDVAKKVPYEDSGDSEAGLLDDQI